MKTRIIISVLILSSVFSFSQTKVADKLFKTYAYKKASELYEVAVEKEDESKHVLTRLGDCYYFNANPEKAAFWYSKAINKYPNINPEYIYKFIQTSKSIGNYEEANKWIAVYKNLKNNPKAKYFDNDYSNKYQELNSSEGLLIKIANLDVNSNFSDFGSYVHNEKIYFSSSKKREDSKIYKWNEEPFLDIYQADINKTNEEVTVNNVKLLPSETVNTPFHEGTIAITNNGNTMYFTRDNLNKKNKLNYDKKGTAHLMLFKATRVNNRWENIIELPFNDKVSSTGHPALSLDNKTLFFVSDKAGGFGKTDIYKVAINKDGTFGTPKNLGSKINTEDQEMFPYIDKENMLYFSSDGYINLGFLDIFKSNILNDSNAEVINLGAPYNSGFDDFAFFMNSDLKSGYFSSNREGGKGGDDIYSFGIYDCKQYIKGKVFDNKTKELLAMVSVQLIDEETGQIIETQTTTAKGDYFFEVNCEKKYSIRGTKIDYKDAISKVTTTDLHKKENIEDLYLIPLIINNEIVISPIFFDFDKWNIRPDAAFELENIVTVMTNHPKMNIKIESHTDSRGRDKYNMKLSDRRAKSTREYLISRNINPNRFESAIGYGESQLINQCDNKVKCSEEEHQLNRRSKFIITTEY